jgi:hydrogenase maturation protease
VKTLLIAIGNRYRRDDGAALALADRLRADDIADLDIVEVSDDVIRLLDIWTAYEFVIVVDAVSAGQEPGTLFRRDPIGSALPRHWFGVSSHQLGIVEAIELGRAMRRLPSRMLFLGIQAGDLGEGEGLTSEVERALTPAIHVVNAAMSWVFSALSSPGDRPPRS